MASRLPEPEKPPVGRTEFGELREEHRALDQKHEELKSRFTSQDRKLRDLEALIVHSGKETAQQGIDLLKNSQATARTERKVDESIEKTEALLAAFEALSGTIKTLEWLGKKVAPIGIGIGVLVAMWDKIFK